jgi:hypothetical protein
MYAKKPRTLQGLGHELKLPVPPFHYKQYKKYVILLHTILNNALTLVEDISDS